MSSPPHHALRSACEDLGGSSERVPSSTSPPRVLPVPLNRGWKSVQSTYARSSNGSDGTLIDHCVRCCTPRCYCSSPCSGTKVSSVADYLPLTRASVASLPAAAPSYSWSPVDTHSSSHLGDEKTEGLKVSRRIKHGSLHNLQQATIYERWCSKAGDSAGVPDATETSGRSALKQENSTGDGADPGLYLQRNNRRLRTAPSRNSRTSSSFLTRFFSSFNKNKLQTDSLSLSNAELAESGVTFPVGDARKNGRPVLLSRGVGDKVPLRKGEADYLSHSSENKGIPKILGHGIVVKPLVVYDTGGINIDVAVDRSTPYLVQGTTSGTVSHVSDRPGGLGCENSTPVERTSRVGAMRLRSSDNSVSQGDSRRCSAESGSLKPPFFASRTTRPCYHFYGESRRNQRHGWGLLVNDERLLFEGQWKSDIVLGWYICYHEYATEFGYRELNEVRAVSVTSDSNYFIVPIVSNAPVGSPFPSDLRNNTNNTNCHHPSDSLTRVSGSYRSSTTASVIPMRNSNSGDHQETQTVSALASEAQKAAVLSRVRRGKQKHRTIHCATAFTITVTDIELPSDEETSKPPSPDTTGTTINTLVGGKSKGSTIMAAAVRLQTAAAQAAREAEMQEGEFSSDDVKCCSEMGSEVSSGLGEVRAFAASCDRSVVLAGSSTAKLDHSYNTTAKDVDSTAENTVSVTAVEDAGHSMGVDCGSLKLQHGLYCDGSRSQESRKSKVSESSTNDIQPSTGIVQPAVTTAAAAVATEAESAARRRRFFRRGATFPEFTTQENLAVEETHLCEGVSRGGSKRGTLTQAVSGSHFLRASDCHKWSSITLTQFLRMIGMAREAVIFKLNKLSGADIPSITGEKLQQLGISDPYVRKFLLSVFRYLWSCTDHRDPLMPQNRRHLQQHRYQLLTIPSSEVKVGSRVGGGGYATVHRATYDGTVVACKIFKYNPRPTAVAAALTNQPWHGRGTGSISRISRSSNTRCSSPGSTASSHTHKSREVDTSGSSEVRMICDPYATMSASLNSLSPAGGTVDTASPGNIERDGSSVRQQDYLTDVCVIDGSGDIQTNPVDTPLRTESVSINSRGSNSSEEREDFGWEWRYARLHNVDFFRYCPLPVKHRDLEADILAALQPHPAIVGLFGKCSIKPGEEALLLEYCSMGGLDTIVYPPENERSGRGRGRWKELSRPQLVQLFEQAAAGLAHVHQCSVLHRDIKLSNILVGESGAKVADFGVSTTYVPSDSPSVLALYGNVFYAAPEVLRGDGYYRGSDVWSFGVAFWEALTARLAYDGKSAGYVFTHVAAGDLQLSLPSDFPPLLKDLFRGMLHVDYSKRPSFEEIGRQLALVQVNTLTAIQQDLDDFFGL